MVRHLACFENTQRETTNTSTILTTGKVGINLPVGETWLHPLDMSITTHAMQSHGDKRKPVTEQREREEKNAVAARSGWA